MKFVHRILACLLAASGTLTVALAQPSPSPANKPEAPVYETLHITWLTQQNDSNDLQTDMRNMLPRTKLYYVPEVNAISVSGPPEDLALARRMLADLDRPRPMYRLVYTLTDIEGGKRVGVQSYTLVIAAGSKTQLKQGSRVPITVAPGRDTPPPQYLDIGLNIEVSLDGSPQGVKLRSKIEQSSLAGANTSSAVQDPVIRQTTLEGAVSLTPGKPLTLGSLDVPGSTRHQEVQVVAEVLP